MGKQHCRYAAPHFGTGAVHGVGIILVTIKVGTPISPYPAAAA